MLLRPISRCTASKTSAAALFGSSKNNRNMATVKDSIPHVVRTAHEPRQAGFWNATLGQIQQINSSIRLLRLDVPKDEPPLRHLPGQYVDLHIPGLESVGGFTITSPPQTCSSQIRNPYIELAIQKSPNNPPAAYLWRPVEEITGSPMSFRIGGNFTYPPFTLNKPEFENIDRVVFVAGGVGINPIMSMLSAMDITGPNTLGGMLKHVRMLYTSRRSKDQDGEPEEILFEKRLEGIAEKWSNSEKVHYLYTLFETGINSEGSSKREDVEINSNAVKCIRRRITTGDLYDALGPENDREHTIVYICGVPQMTDEFVDLLQNAPGMDEKRVLCEKWW